MLPIRKLMFFFTFNTGELPDLAGEVKSVPDKNQGFINYGSSNLNASLLVGNVTALLLLLIFGHQKFYVYIAFKLFGSFLPDRELGNIFG